MKARYHIVEARWESGTRQDFFEIEVLCGTLADAQKVAEDYVHLREPLIWRPGDSDENGPVYYASHPSITFRIRS
jgi:hypothetical protein